MICGGICPSTNRCRAWRLVGKRGRHSFPSSLVLDQAISRTFYAETARPGIRPGRTRKLCRRVLPWPIFDRYHCSSLRHAQQQAHQGVPDPNLIIRPSNLEYSFTRIITGSFSCRAFRNFGNMESLHKNNGDQIFGQDSLRQSNSKAATSKKI